MKREIETKFYEFSQNNSGGHYDVDENVCSTVLVEAIDESHAISKMEKFTENGSGSCYCCGERWSLYSPDEVEYSDEWKPYMGICTTNPAAIIHFIDGAKKLIPKEEE